MSVFSNMTYGTCMFSLKAIPFWVPFASIASIMWFYALGALLSKTQIS